EAALADALLHPRDRAYSVPQVFEFLETAGLRFGRWLKQAPYSPHCGMMAHLTHASRLTSLAPAEQSAAAGARVSFSDPACLNYVPIRMPETMCVRDRPHPGAAAVLINQTHTYTD